MASSDQARIKNYSDALLTLDGAKNVNSINKAQGGLFEETKVGFIRRDYDGKIVLVPNPYTIYFFKGVYQLWKNGDNNPDLSSGYFLKTLPGHEALVQLVAHEVGYGIAANHIVYDPSTNRVKPIKRYDFERNTETFADQLFTGTWKK